MESSQLSAKCLKISVRALYNIFLTVNVQTRGMYTDFHFVCNDFDHYLISKKDVRNMWESGLTYALLTLEFLEVSHEILALCSHVELGRIGPRLMLG